MGLGDDWHPGLCAQIGRRLALAFGPGPSWLRNGETCCPHSALARRFTVGHVQIERLRCARCGNARCLGIAGTAGLILKADPQPHRLRSRRLTMWDSWGKVRHHLSCSAAPISPAPGEIASTSMAIGYLRTCPCQERYHVDPRPEWTGNLPVPSRFHGNGSMCHRISGHCRQDQPSALRHPGCRPNR